MDKFTKNCIYLCLLMIVTILYWFQGCMHADLLEDKYDDIFDFDILSSRVGWLLFSIAIAIIFYCKDVYFNQIKLYDVDVLPTPEPVVN